MGLAANIVWKSGMEFTAHLDGFEFAIDVAADAGGTNQGPRPKGFILVALAGCTGLDVISMLHKMRIFPDFFEIATTASVAETHPKKIETIVMRYIFKGANLPIAKIWRAVDLSETHYCGVSATLKPAVAMSVEVVINDQVIARPLEPQL